MRCHECNGEKFEPRMVELSTRVGEHTVLDRSVTRPACIQCGEYTVSATTLEQVELRAVVAFTNTERVSGAMLRFARKALGLTQAELGERIGATLESVSRWEREERPMELMPSPRNVELLRVG